MEDKISESAYEIAIGSMQMQCKRLFILCIVIFVALIGTNAAWIYHECQYADNVTTTVESTSESGDAYGAVIDGDNSEVNYGTSEDHSDEN